jgi:hypothetical protein
MHGYYIELVDISMVKICVHVHLARGVDVYPTYIASGSHR